MNREQSFKKLWDIIKSKPGALENDVYLELNHKNIYLELTRDDYYQDQIYISSDSGFATIDIETLLDKDDSEHDWCWKQLYKLNIRKRDIK